MRILFLTQLFPYPPVCGGTIRSYNILRHLATQHKVTLVSFIRKDPTLEQMKTVSSLCRKIRTVPIKRTAKANAKFAASSLILKRPFIVSRDKSADMQRTIDELLITEQYDLIYVDHLQMAQYVLSHKTCPKILDEHNVEWRIIERIAENEGKSPKGLFAGIEWPKLRQWELNACEKFDLVFTVTENDKNTLKSENPRIRNISCLPIGVDLDEFASIQLNQASKSIVSIGTMSWPPNIDSVMHFSEDIYPEIKSRVDGINFIVAGNKPPKEVKELAEKDNSVEVTGFVEDISTVAAKTAVFVVPLRSGSGMRVKILNAMAMGLPIVSTSVGCEGIGAKNGEHLLIADHPKDFADAVVRLLNDYELRTRLAKNARTFVEANYAWSSIYQVLDEKIDALRVKSVASTGVFLISF